MPDLQTIVERMVAAGEPEENIAAVVQHYPQVAVASQSQPEATAAQGTNGALAMAGASRIVPLAMQGAMQGAKAAWAAPNAPRIIQRAIGAGVRGASVAAGAAIGGVPGAIGAAAMSEGLTPTQGTIRGWLGRTASAAAPHTGDAVANYIDAMGADVNNLTGAALEYAKKAGRAILYDANGRAGLVPVNAAPSVPVTAAPGVISRGVGAAAKGLNVLSGAQGALDLAQMAEPNRKDIGLMGMGGSADEIDNATMDMMNKISHGMKPIEAAKQATQQNPSLYPRVIDRWARAGK